MARARSSVVRVYSSGLAAIAEVIRQSHATQTSRSMRISHEAPYQLNGETDPPGGEVQYAISQSVRIA
jgi:hypothetical protein